MSFPTPYITIEDVRPWLRGKVSFGDDPVFNITDDFFQQIVDQAQGMVLADIRKFYWTPLQSKTTNTYAGLPFETQIYLKQLFILKSVEMVLIEEFGREGAVIGDNYATPMGTNYKAEINKMFKKGSDGRYMIFPLPDLMLNPYSYTGLTVMPPPQIVETYPGASLSMEYAMNQITKPYLAWWSFADYGTGTGNNC